jgi:hypothetical protein
LAEAGNPCITPEFVTREVAMPRNDTLWKRLESARLPELRKLGEIMGLAELEAKVAPVLVEELSKEIRSAAGHSLRNVFRGHHEFPYKQLLIDVGDKMAPGWTFLSWTPYTLHDNNSEEEIEETIWRFFEKTISSKINSLSQANKEQLRRDTERELRSFGYSEALVTQVGAGLVGAIGATFMAPSLAYYLAMTTSSGFAALHLWWVGKASMAAVLGVGSGIFTLLYAPVIAWWLGNTAYRKTIPAALYLIQIRKLREIEGDLDRGPCLKEP